MVDGILRVGIEVVLVFVIESGDKVLVFIFGCFGYLFVEIVECVDVDVYIIEVLWGEVFIVVDIEKVI